MRYKFGRKTVSPSLNQIYLSSTHSSMMLVRLPSLDIVLQELEDKLLVNILAEK